MIASLSVPCHSGTGAGSSGRTRPSSTSRASAAWAIDLAMLHEISGVAASTGAGSATNRFAGCVP